MQSSTTSLRYESVYATDAAGLTRAAALEGVAVAAAVAVRRRVPGAPLAVVVAVDAADNIASRSTTSRTRSSMDTCCVAAAPRRDRRPPPPRSLGMQVTVASFRLRGSACRFILLDRWISLKSVLATLSCFSWALLDELAALPGFMAELYIYVHGREEPFDSWPVNTGF